MNTKGKQDTHGMRLAEDCCDNRTRSDASVLVLTIVFLSFIVAGMLIEIFQINPVNTKGKQDMHGMRLADDCCDNRTRSDASVLVWRILFRSFIVAGMLLEIYEHKGKQDTHAMRLADDCCDNRTRSDASVLVRRILFLSFIVAGLLLEIFQTTPVNNKGKRDTHGMRLADNRCDNQIFLAK
jgi:hypothetical protein